MPVIVLASVPDNDFALILCRDVHMQREGTFLEFPVRLRLCQTHVLASRNQRDRINFVVQGLASRVHDWPLHEFPPSLEHPTVMCQNANCGKYTSPTDTRLVEPYREHQSPSRRQIDSDVKQLSRIRWRQEYAALAEAEIASASASAPEAKHDPDVIRPAVYAKFEAKVRICFRACDHWALNCGLR